MKREIYLCDWCSIDLEPTDMVVDGELHFCSQSEQDSYIAESEEVVTSAFERLERMSWLTRQKFVEEVQSQVPLFTERKHD